MKQMTESKSRPVKKQEIHAPFPGHGHACLNCGSDVSGSYCAGCGQKTATHRLSVMHFVLHDLVHSLWHLDRGIFFTLKEVLMRPGYAALDYIRGRRVGKFPILTLLLLLLGALLWLNSFDHTATNNFKVSADATKMVKWLAEFVPHNIKWILLSLLPISSISTLIIFNKTCLNYTEHLVVNSYVFGGLLVALFFIKLVELAFPATIPYAGGWVGPFGVVFYLMGYWQAYHRAYTKGGIAWRFIALFFLEIFIFIVIIIILFMIVALVLREPGQKHL